MTKFLHKITIVYVALCFVVLSFPLQVFALSSEDNTDAPLQLLANDDKFSFNWTSSKSTYSVGDTVKFDLTIKNLESLLTDEMNADVKDLTVVYGISSYSFVDDNNKKHDVDVSQKGYVKGTSYENIPTMAGTYSITFQVLVLIPVSPDKADEIAPGYTNQKILNSSDNQYQTVEFVVKPQTSSSKPPTTPTTQTKKITMYRLYNPNSGEHLYTQDVSEYNYLGRIGWRGEGEAWLAPETSNTPVYRLYNPNSGDHHYTTDQSEYKWLQTLGWRGEGIGWYSGGSKPVYRLFNPNETVGTHHYTTDLSEYKWLQTLGWRGEDIGWYSL